MEYEILSIPGELLLVCFIHRSSSHIKKLSLRLVMFLGTDEIWGSYATWLVGTHGGEILM